MKKVVAAYPGQKIHVVLDIFGRSCAVNEP
jgi:hypothetical protein